MDAQTCSFILQGGSQTEIWMNSSKYGTKAKQNSDFEYKTPSSLHPWGSSAIAREMYPVVTFRKKGEKNEQEQRGTIHDISLGSSHVWT